MSDFKSFVKVMDTDVKNSSTKELTKKINSEVSVVAQDTSNNEVSKFSGKVVDIAYSDAVISELSNTIGEPNKEESEDEFVDRTKLALYRILKRKLFR
ncbi:hypothetical protein [Idiomarina zobellii]|uniref:Uncharacterized protein n=1 Tax=Idiomarina zobellii TaxID=86103 RepID=A0A837NEY1_9GAMM|nr:hypothetical protein [Idiomarina zobellii]KPD23177.1 hypothetical protein AFK76_09995 [Idiomarina zobellii]SDG08223.1 hypothetical protein SAMN04515658_1126 [Idiomarina zobellii]